MEGVDLDYRKRETHLYFMLVERYHWDIAKFVFVVFYLVWALVVVIGSYLGYEIIPSEVQAFIRLPAVATVGFALFTLWRQWVNIKRYRDEILPKAEKIAEKHARIGRERQPKE